MKVFLKKIRGWGGTPVVKAAVNLPETIEEVQVVVQKNRGMLARGGGNSYGDSSLTPQAVSTRRLSHILNQGEDWIEAEAGTSIEQLLQQLLPHRRFLAVTPGTRAVTVGGAIASDVHGKNHLTAGSFFNITESLMLIDGTGEPIHCSRLENAALFYSCFGGMGLPGIIVSAVIKTSLLPSYFIRQQQFIATAASQMFRLMEQHKEASYLVGWMNLLSDNFEGVVKTGEWDMTQQSKMPPVPNVLTLPFRFPIAPPRLLFRWYNQRYFTKAMRQPDYSIPLLRFFYPLDGIRNWRYAFGPKGLLQYHFRLPAHVSEKGITEIIQLVKTSKAVCTLAVLKCFGQGNAETVHSFAREGYNLALDFIHTSAAVRLIHQLDEVVAFYGGTLYKTKDAVSRLPQAIESGVFQSIQNQRYAAGHEK